jgi:DNA-binding winged helix-turn-helix (wHTH) protein
VFDVLTQLVINRERCVTKEELFDAVWGGRFVGEAALTSRRLRDSASRSVAGPTGCGWPMR